MAADETNDIGLFLMRLMAQYYVGAASLMPGNEQLIYGQAAALDVGTMPQRQRFVVLAAELAGREEAGEQLRELDDLRTIQGRQLTEADAAVQAALFELYGDGKASAAAELSDRSKQVLRDHLGWFGELALAPDDGGDASARQAVLATGKRVMFIIVAAFTLGALTTLAGLVGLLIMLVLLIQRRLRSRVPAGGGHHGLYAETFVVWLGLFLGLLTAAGAAGQSLPSLALPFTLAAFLASLSALAWPVMRGVPWSLVRADIGWTTGSAPLGEPMIGVVSYAMALPLLCVGLGISLILMFVAGVLAPPPESFEPAATPAHPLVLDLAAASPWGRLQILLLGTIAAPIVEETMFRGVFYRHLRDATRRWGHVLSIVIAGAATGLIFAAVHPQGWMAVPALMSLAVAFALAREWRGTLIVPMVMHGVSNGLVISTILLLLAA
jgi:membrane protease YdiL (CAAX protease family)